MTATIANSAEQAYLNGFAGLKNLDHALHYLTSQANWKELRNENGANPLHLLMQATPFFLSDSYSGLFSDMGGMYFTKQELEKDIPTLLKECDFHGRDIWSYAFSSQKESFDGYPNVLGQRLEKYPPRCDKEGNGWWQLLLPIENMLEEPDNVRRAALTSITYLLISMEDVTCDDVWIRDVLQPPSKEKQEHIANLLLSTENHPETTKINFKMLSKVLDLTDTAEQRDAVIPELKFLGYIERLVFEDLRLPNGDVMVQQFMVEGAQKLVLAPEGLRFGGDPIGASPEPPWSNRRPVKEWVALWNLLKLNPKAEHLLGSIRSSLETRWKSAALAGVPRVDGYENETEIPRI